MSFVPVWGHLLGLCWFLALAQSYRDDMESLGYVLLYFLCGSLPWWRTRGTGDASQDECILRLKQETTADELCAGLPKQFASYFRHIRSLGFNDKPNYDNVRKIFRALLIREGYEHDNVFDWTILKFLMNQEDSNSASQG